MSPAGARRRPCDREFARHRLDRARAFMQLAQFGDRQPDTALVAAANAVQAAIAAADALCCISIKAHARGSDHREAVALIRETAPGSGSAADKRRRAHQLGKALDTALVVKNQAEYGVEVITTSVWRRVVRAATQLIEAAEVELSR